MRSCSPVLLPRMHVGTVVPSLWDHVFPSLIPRRHVRSDVPYLWDPAVPSLYPVGMFDLVFPTREILQPHPDTSQACSIWCAEPLRSCSPDPAAPYACSVLGPYPWDPAAPYACALWCPNPWNPAARVHVRSVVPTRETLKHDMRVRS